MVGMIVCRQVEIDRGRARNVSRPCVSPMASHPSILLTHPYHFHRQFQVPKARVVVTHRSLDRSGAIGPLILLYCSIYSHCPFLASDALQNGKKPSRDLILPRRTCRFPRPRRIYLLQRSRMRASSTHIPPQPVRIPIGRLRRGQLEEVSHDSGDQGQEDDQPS